LRSVVVETCVDCCAADFAAPTAVELLEYCENLFAMTGIGILLWQALSLEGCLENALYAATRTIIRFRKVRKVFLRG
jgi:hypothetical protein